MITPPRPPELAEREALIKEARDRQRRRRLAAATSVAVIAGLAIAIDAGSGGGSAPPQRDARAGAAPLSATPWCRAQTTPAWRSLARRYVVPASRRMTLLPFALGDDGRSFFAEVYRRHGFSGVARVDARSGKVLPIRAFPQPSRDSASGAFDGRWLVWAEWHAPAPALADFTTWAWDSHTGRLSKIGQADRAPNGRVWDYAGLGPVVRDGIAAWTQGSGPNGMRDIHLYDLRTGTDKIVHVRRAGDPRLFAGRLVAWSTPTGRGSLEAKAYAASASTGKPMAVPRALRAAGRNLFALGTDGRAIAYESGKTLWWSPSLRQRPQRVVTARGFRWIDFPLHVGGGYLGFGMEPGLFIGDTRVHRFVRVGTYGAVETNASALLIIRPGSTSKSLYRHMSVSLVPLADVPPMPACAG